MMDTSCGILIFNICFRGLSVFQSLPLVQFKWYFQIVNKILTRILPSGVFDKNYLIFLAKFYLPCFSFRLVTKDPLRISPKLYSSVAAVVSCSVLFYHRSSCYCFRARGIVSVICSIALSKGCKPFRWDLWRAATSPICTLLVYFGKCQLIFWKILLDDFN